MEGQECSSHIDVSLNTGGRLKHFISFWESITSFDFDEELPQLPVPRQIFCSHNEKLLIDLEIEKFIKAGIIEQVRHCPGEFISNIFSVPKKSGGVRIILNLKPFNRCLSYENFKMEHLNTAIGLMDQNCFMTSIDLNSTSG